MKEAMDIALLTALGAAGISELAANLPLTANEQRISKTPAGHEGDPQLETLKAAVDPYIEKTGGTPDVRLALNARTPEGNNILQRYRKVRSNPTDYAGSGLHPDDKSFNVGDMVYPTSVTIDGTTYKQEPVNYNPNADRAFLAHELGHVVGHQRGLGALAHRARTSPAIKRAMNTAMALAPLGYAAAAEGDDDLAASLGLAYAAYSPVIYDEINATRHGLGLLDQAGMRATGPQRARLAGALLSYLALPAMTGVVANRAGNIVEDFPVM